MAKAFNKVLGIIMVIAILLSLGVTAIATDFGTVTLLGKAENTNSSAYVYGGTTANIIVIKQASNVFVAWVDGTVPDSNSEIIAGVKAGDPSLSGMAGYVTRSTSFNLGTVMGQGGNNYNFDVTIDTAAKTIAAIKSGEPGETISHFSFYSYYTPPITTEYGELTVSKAVLGENAPDESFDITVAFTGDYASINNNGGLTGTGGSYTASLKHGESVSFSNIPMGVKYTVTETPLSTAQTAAGWTAGEIIDGTGIISGAAAVSVVINNSYTAPPPPPEYGNLSVDKIVSGVGADPTESFYISVQFSSKTAGDVALIENNAELAVSQNGAYLFSLSANSTPVSFSNIPMGVSYTVSEELSTAQIATGWSKGAITAGSGTVSSTAAIAVKVNNIYTEPVIEPEYSSLKIIKSVSGISASLTEEFEITVVFDGDYEGIANNAGLSGTNGSYTFSLHDGEYVIFTNIPEGVSKTVEETLTPAQTASGWSKGAITGGGIVPLVLLPIEPELETLTVNNIYTAPPVIEYGSLKVEKNVSGDEASETEEFEISVIFSDNYVGISNNGGLSGESGLYTLSLHDGESVIFSDIPMGVSYTVIEKLSEAQIGDGWSGPGPEEGTIDSTTQIGISVENVYAKADPLGEDEDLDDPDEDPEVVPEGETEDLTPPTLPQTGGVPKSAFLGLLGLLFILSGTVLSIIKRRKKTQ